jgi:hypothetical protein
VPGLLQTDDYARTVITADNPAVDEAEIDRRVHVRVARQALLSRPAARPELRVILNEAILRRPVGDPAIMARQLRHLAEASDLANVSMRVVPFSAGLHRGVMSGPFEILRFPRNGDGRESEPPTVFADGFTGDLYLDKPVEVDRHTAAFAAIWDAALEERTSRILTEQAAKEMKP